MSLVEQQELRQPSGVTECVGSLPLIPLDRDDWMSMTTSSRLSVRQFSLEDSLGVRKQIITKV
jgi:hypothetical protein